MATRYMINLTVTLPSRYPNSTDLEIEICDAIFAALGENSEISVDIVESEDYE